MGKRSYINNNSLVAMITVGKTKFLSAGDIEKEQENALINEKVSLSADIMKLSHHACETSNSEKFINKVNPKYAFYSRLDESLDGNFQFKYEDNKVCSTVQNVKKGNVYGRASNGNLTFTIKNNNIKVDMEKNYYTITVNYVDESSDEKLGSKTYKFHNKETFKKVDFFEKYYLYNWYKDFDGYSFDSSKNQKNGFKKDSVKSGKAPNKNTTLKVYYKKK